MTGLGFLLWAVLNWANWTVHGLLGNLPFLLFYTFFGRAFEFTIGMILAQRWQQGRLAQLRYPTAIGLLVMGTCIIWQSYIMGFLTNANWLALSEVIVYNYLLPVGIALFFLGLLREKTVVSTLLAQPLMQALGHSSYAFYLIHIGVLSRMTQKTGLANSVWVLFVLLLILAHGLHLWVEKPLQKHLRSRY